MSKKLWPDPNRWTTRILAVDPETNKLRVFIGPVVPGASKEEAEDYCATHELEYCQVISPFFMKTVLYEN